MPRLADVVSDRQRPLRSFPRLRGEGGWGGERAFGLWRQLGNDNKTGIHARDEHSLWQACEKRAQNGVVGLAALEEGRLVDYRSVKDVMHVLALSSDPKVRRARW